MLDSVDLELPAGLTTAVMGPGGSGKTTLMRALAGPPYSTSMWVRGERPAWRSVLRVPQRHQRAIGSDVLDCLESPTPGAILLIDEPFVTLPSKYHDELHLRLDELRQSHTILCVSHNLKHARRLADYVVLIVDGELIEAASTEDFFTRPAHSRTSDFLATGS